MQKSAKKNEADLLHALAMAEEREREQIARSIHSVNTLLSLVKINMQKAGRHMHDKERLELLAKENYKALDESMQTISSAVRELSPPMFSRIGYLAAMSELCRKIQTEENKITWNPENQTKTNLTPQSELQLYRLSKEVLQCLLHDARTRKIAVSFHEKGKKYELCFNHDAKNIDVRDTRRYNIVARALLAGAEIKCEDQKVIVTINYGNKK